MKRFFLIAAAVLAVSLIFQSCKDKSVQNMPTPSVHVIEVIQQDIPVMEEFVGQTYGFYDIALQARVDGFVEGIFFEEGRSVRKGQLLYSIESEPYEAKVNAARGQLAEVQTRLVKAESDLTRIKPLAAQNAVSQSDLDAALAQRDAAKAAVEAAEANLESARIELGFTRIYSPLDGIIGKTQVFPGDYVGKGFNNTALNEVSRIDTILVNFHLPEEKYLEMARFIRQQDPATPREERPRSPLTLILADGSVYPEEGKFEFADRQVNASTGTILLQASFPNPEAILRPGQFARIRAVIERIEGGLLVPQRCVQELQGNYNVFVVNETSEVEFRKIEVASSYQTRFMIVSSGLEPGERVIYEGLQKVRSGARVNPVVQEISMNESEN